MASGFHGDVESSVVWTAKGSTVATGSSVIVILSVTLSVSVNLCVSVSVSKLVTMTTSVKAREESVILERATWMTSFYK